MLRSVALQNAASIHLARQRAEQELLKANEALKAQTEALARALAVTEASLVERDRARDEAEQARHEAQKASSAKSRFLNVVSHELRTPLGAIGGYAALLDDEINGPVTAEQRQYVSRIRHNQSHMLRLVNELLDLARIESGQFTLDPAPISVHTVIESAYVMIEPQVRASMLRMDLPSIDPALAFHADRERVEQIVLNLLSNAVKFTAEGGTVSIMVAPSPDRVYLTVSDTGMGIPTDKLDAVFEAFVQVDASPGDPRRGTGLGLAISRELAHAMAGDLTVKSTPGEGSAFMLDLPRSDRTV